MNAQILQDKAYYDMIINQLEWAMENFQYISAQEKWECIKPCIIANTQVYCNEHAAQNKLIIIQWEQTLENCTLRGIQNLNENETKVFLHTQNDLDDEYMRKTQGAIFCSGVQFYDEGE